MRRFLARCSILAGVSLAGIVSGETEPLNLVLPTENDALFRGGGAEFYQYIERDYKAFNEERSAFYREQGLAPLPASTGIQAILCRPDLLIEIEAIAMFRRASPKE